MPLIKLPIHQGINKQTDEVGLVSHGPELINGYVNDYLGVDRWPGYEEFADTGEISSIDGGYWWDSQSRSIVICNGKTFQITDSSGSITETGPPASTFEVATRVKFADFGSNLFGANGAKIQQITTSSVTEMADADAPTTVSHVAVLDRYLIGNEVGSGNFHWSDVNAPTSWSAEYSEMEANPDNLVALDVQNLNIYGLGKKTLEKFYDDGSTPFIRLYQGVVQSGTVAKYSFTWCPAVSTFCWIDENLRVVMLQGGLPVPILSITNKYIKEMSIVSDAIGDYVEISGRPFYILTFPSEGTTIAFDFFSKNWSRLGSWNSTAGEYDRYRANCYWNCPDWNLTLIGDKANGKVYKLADNIYDEDGALLRTAIRTGHMDHGSGRVKKFCNGIYARLKRKYSVDDDTVPEILVRYRDNGATAWSGNFALTLDNVSDTEFLAHATMLGSYSTRQWEFYITDAYPTVIASVEEDVDFERI